MIPKENAFLDPNMSQEDFNMLQLNLRVEAEKVKEMSFEWKYEVNNYYKNYIFVKYTLKHDIKFNIINKNDINMMKNNRVDW